MKQLIICAFALCTIVACNKNQSSKNVFSDYKTDLAEPAAAVTDESFKKEGAEGTFSKTDVADKSSSDKNNSTTIENVPVKNADAKIIRNGFLRMQVQSVNDARSSLLADVKKLGGYLESEHAANDNSNTELQLVLRVPNEKFEALIDRSSLTASFIERKDITTEDVTDSYVDIESRLKTKRMMLARYTDLLQRSGKMSDLLEVEQQIETLQEDIESTEARLRALDNKVSYSTLNITVYELRAISSTPGISYFSKLKSGFANGWEGLSMVFLGLVNIWPLMLVVIALVFFVSRKINKSKRIVLK